MNRIIRTCIHWPFKTESIDLLGTGLAGVEARFDSVDLKLSICPDFTRVTQNPGPSEVSLELRRRFENIPGVAIGFNHWAPQEGTFQPNISFPRQRREDACVSAQKMFLKLLQKIGWTDFEIMFGVEPTITQETYWRIGKADPGCKWISHGRYLASSVTLT